MNVTVAHPSQARCLAAHHLRWVYVDDDQDLYWRIAAAIGTRSAPLLAPEAFQLKVEATRAVFVDWSDRCLAGTMPEGWITTPLYRNPHDNSLFLHFCWLTAINEALNASTDGLLIVTESSGFADAVRSLCQSRGISHAVAGRARLRLARMLRSLRATAGLCANALSLLCRMLLARAILGDSYRRRLGGVELIVDTYLLEGDLAANGLFRDRYFPGLIDYYRLHDIVAASRPLLYGVSIVRSGAIFQCMQRSATPFILLELFATPADVASALWKSVKGAIAHIPLAVTPALPIDLGPIVKWHQPWTAMRAFLALVMLRFPMRIVAAGLHPRWVIEWYENQPIDKASQIGFSALGTDCEVIAVRQFPPAPDFLSLYTTAEEVRSGVSPRENWVCGRAQMKAMSIYDSVGNYRVVPALRYAHLHRETTQLHAGTQLLVLLPYSKTESRRVLRCALFALETAAHFFERVVIKPHPTVTSATARADAEHEWPETAHSQVEWSEAPLATVLSDARIVVSAHSSAALEAVCAGKPVILIGCMAGLAINALENIDNRLWRVVYDAPGLVAALKAWSPEHPLPFELRMALGTEIRNESFEPANDSTMNAFIPGRSARQ